MHPIISRLKGKFIDYKVNSGGTMSTLPDAPLEGQTKGEQVKVYKLQGLIKSSLVEDPPIWSFTFLKYMAGAVTTAPLTGHLMTGPMSGCYLFKYKKGDALHVAHVGTAHGKDSDETKKAKQVWTGIADGAAEGASPFDTFSIPEQVAVKRDNLPPIVVGYFADGVFLAMLLAPGNDKVKIADVRQVTTKSWDELKTSATFAPTT